MHAHALDPNLIDVNTPGEAVFPTIKRLSDRHAEIQVAGQLYRQIDERSWSIPARLRDMDAEGVAAQVLSPTPVTLCYEGPVAAAVRLAQSQNDFLASMVAQAPSRFFALGAVALQDPDSAVIELTRCVEELHFAGVEIGTQVAGNELTHPSLRPFFRRAAQLSAVVFIHPVDRTLDARLVQLGIGFGYGMPAETSIAAAGLLMNLTLNAIDGAQLCLAHGGGALPAVLPRLARGAELAGDPDLRRRIPLQARHMWSDSLTYDVDSLALAMTRFGSDHVVLGTDYPFAARESPAGAILAELDPADRSNVGRTNAVAMLSRVGVAGPQTEEAER